MRQRVARVRHGVDLESVVDQHLDDQFTYEDFVLHHQHARGDTLTSTVGSFLSWTRRMLSQHQTYALFATLRKFKKFVVITG